MPILRPCVGLTFPQTDESIVPSVLPPSSTGFLHLFHPHVSPSWCGAQCSTPTIRLGSVRSAGHFVTPPRAEMSSPPENTLSAGRLNRARSRGGRGSHVRDAGPPRWPSAEGAVGGARRPYSAIAALRVSSIHGF